MKINENDILSYLSSGKAKNGSLLSHEMQAKTFQDFVYKGQEYVLKIEVVNENFFALEDKIKKVKIIKNPYLLRYNFLKKYPKNNLFTSEECLVSITKYMKHGNLANFLKLNYRRINIPKLIKRIVQGFHHLHTKGLLHGDVNVYNILMGRKNFYISPQIFDMNFFEPKDPSIGLFANPEYLAPEIKTYSDYDIRAELWGIGVLIFQIVSNGRLPFGTRINKTTIEEIRNNAKAYKFIQGSPLIGEFPEPFKTILGLLLVLDPENRANSLVPVIKLL